MVLARRLGWPAFYLMDNAFSNSIRLGEWDWAAAELEPMIGDDVERLSRSVAIADLISLRAYRGEPTADLAAHLEAMPSSGADSVSEGATAWSKAAIAFAKGQYDAARSEVHRYQALFNQGAAEALLWGTRCALLSRDIESARHDLDQADAIERRGRAIDTERKTLRAGVTALDGKPHEALALYRDALNVWRDLGLVWDEALCAIDMASLLGPGEPDVTAVAERARETLVRLRAQPFLERLDSAMAARPDRPAGTTPSVQEQAASV
jgi:tetratricopeptide (TPR) repeat protein